MTRQTGGGYGVNEEGTAREPLPGIVIAGGGGKTDPRAPRISAFIWGGKVRPVPTLPYGRWKGAA